MRQGSQVTLSPQGTVGIYHWQDIVIIEIGQPLNSGYLNPGIPVGEGLDLQQQHQPGYLLGNLIPRPACM